jgi:allantoin racemase
VRGTPLAVLEESRRAIADDRAEAICLGCAGMGTLECEVRDGLDGIPVIDGVAAAVKMLEGLVGLGLGTSRRAAFMEPGPKELTGSEPFLEGLRSRIPAPSGVR